MPSFFTNDYQMLIKYLVSARRNQRITQVQLAAALRVGQGVVSRIERCERRIDAIEFYHICTLLDVAPIDIYNRFSPRFSALTSLK